MATLTIQQGRRTKQLSFTPPALLSALLAEAGTAIGQPCGGHGVCGKCTVMLSGHVSAPNATEQRFGTRLSCQAVITGDACVTIPEEQPMHQIAGGSQRDLPLSNPMSSGIGAAVDIGTTTIALLLYDLQNGKCLSSASMLNPQSTTAADVIGRISAAMNGSGLTLHQQVDSAIDTLLSYACTTAAVSSHRVDALVITGNTTMLYLLTERDPACLSRAPFQADFLFGNDTEYHARKVFIPDCMHAFVGADTSCAILACGMLDQSETALLCDVGTNGELALWHAGKLYIASTAAGPAFEGAGISCGCGSISGAIHRAEISDGKLICHTISDQKAVGICGSGLVDVIAALLELEILDETGLLETGSVALRDDIILTQADIRSVQLAKAATHAGIMSLLSAADCPLDAVQTVYLAGGFGSHLNIRSAVKIGLIPAALENRVQVVGNAALDGAALLLTNTDLRRQTAQMRQIAQHVRLDGNPEFVQHYVDAMLFGIPDE